MSKRRRYRAAARPQPAPAGAPAPQASPPASRAAWKKRTLQALLLGALAFVAYYPCLHGGFIWDDSVLLTENPLVKASDGLYRFWFTTEPPDYWPLTSTSFWLEWRLWGLDSTGYHATNLGLHVVESLLLWALLARLGIGGAFFAALLFAVHPVNVESVAWIAQRKNLVAMLFLLPAILCYLEADAQPPRSGLHRRAAARWYWLSLALFLLALLGKGSVAILPLVLLLLVYWRRRRIVAWDLLRLVPFVVVAAVLVLVNIWFQTHGRGPIRDAGLLERLLGAGAVVWFYLGKALLPIDLAFVYPQWRIVTTNPLWWLPLMASVAVTLGLYRARQGPARPLFFAWAFFCVALVPVMGLTDVYFMTYSLVADHYQHIALVGVVALAGAALDRWRSRGPLWSRRLAFVAGSAVVAVLTLFTARQSATYEDAETLYRANLASYPDVWMVHYNLGVELDATGRAPEALSHFEHTIRAKPDYAPAHNNLAIALAAQGRTAQALERALEAVRLRPELPEPRVTLGSLLVKEGRAAEALPHLERALAARPGSAEVQYNLGMALSALGRLPEAIARYQEALRLDPASAPSHDGIGTALVAAGRPEEALAAFEAALRIDPAFAEAHANLALALVRSGRSAEAIGHYERALALKPDQAEAQYNLGTLLAAAGRSEQAIARLAEAARLRPDYAEAHNNRGVVLAGLGRRAEAHAAFEAALRARPDFAEARANLARTGAARPTPPSADR